ncbi:hypothetical protein QR680_016906 [Steinernema hermaphroditum]|uniref:7TM GPCR serpentine receptor class x (Srx) domain-containing protein n=1 Tax=Steinernema hermaphroditum TaxID=289476 RepID=A0AA39HDN3_9BILA|nr:hypothetical protein QR680_016906 [Steinernema hermaphroditum]
MRSLEMGVMPSPKATSAFEPSVVASMIVILSVSAIVLDVFLLVSVRKLKIFWNSFGALSASRSVAHLATAAIHVVWCAPLTYMQVQPPMALTVALGSIVYVADFASLLSNLSIAATRLLAVCCFLRYKLLQKKMTWCTVVCSWTVAICFTIILCIQSKLLYYDPFQYVWYPLRNPGFFTEMHIDLTFTCISVAIDFATLTKIIHHNVAIKPKAGSTSSFNQEVRFFVQIALQNVFNLGNLLCIQYMGYGKSPMRQFLLDLALWLLSFTVDALLFMLVNPEVKKFMVRPKVIVVSSSSQSA